MRSRTLIAALIFLALSAVKLLLPEKTSQIRDFIVPAVSREVNLRDDIIALGRAISGGGNYIYVWEHWINSGNGKSEKAAPPEVSETPSPNPSPSPKSVETNSFKLTKMINQNLIGFEDLVGLKNVDSNDTSENHSDPSPTIEASPSPTVETPTSTAADNESAKANSLVSSEMAPETSPSTLETKNNAKVDAFLKEQAAFLDHALPANVSYDYPTLPFEHTQPVVSSVTSGFGYRVHPIDGVVKFHYGSDFGVVDGSDISAFANGIVISVQEFDGYGLTVIIDHGNDFSTLYAHCSQILVKQGDKVKRGDKIALSGHSGRVTGPHMHFELIRSGIYLNPEFYI